MLETLSATADRLLARLAPKAAASASTTVTTRHYVSSSYTCSWSGIPYQAGCNEVVDYCKSGDPHAYYETIYYDVYC